MDTLIAVDSKALAQVFVVSLTPRRQSMAKRARTRADFSVTTADLQDELHEFMALHEEKDLPKILAPLATVHRDRTNRQGEQTQLTYELVMKCPGELISVCVLVFDCISLNLYRSVCIEQAQVHTFQYMGLKLYRSACIHFEI